MTTTWRCHPDIASFSDTIFKADWGFPKTESMNSIVTGHDGIVLVHSQHINDYIQAFNPRCLRASASSGNAFDLDYLNFGLAKGTSFKRVLIVPTAGILEFVQDGTYLDPFPAAKFYVAVTRAEQSVAIIVDDPGESPLPYWNPQMAG